MRCDTPQIYKTNQRQARTAHNQAKRTRNKKLLQPPSVVRIERAHQEHNKVCTKKQQKCIIMLALLASMAVTTALAGDPVPYFRGRGGRAMESVVSHKPGSFIQKATRVLRMLL